MIDDQGRGLKYQVILDYDGVKGVKAEVIEYQSNIILSKTSNDPANTMCTFIFSDGKTITVSQYLSLFKKEINNFTLTANEIAECNLYFSINQVNVYLSMLDFLFTNMMMVLSISLMLSICCFIPR